MRVLKVTIGASGASPITTNPNLYASIICFQNQGAAAMSIGDNEVLVNGGIILATGTPGGSGTFQMNFARGTHLVDWWVAGTAGQVMLVLYEAST
jgi:hypothetical protein